MRLIMIRHGASAHSQRRIIASGSACPGLTETGFQQVELLAKRLQPVLLEKPVLLSSPALRAYQTAEVLARVVAQPIIPADLTEIHTGDAEGLTWDAYRAQYGAFNLPDEPDRPFAPNGENWRQYLARVRATLQYLAETYTGQTVLAATHAGFIVASMLVLFEMSGKGKGWLEPRYTSLTEWQVSGERWILTRHNDDTHLETS